MEVSQNHVTYRKFVYIKVRRNIPAPHTQTFHIQDLPTGGCSVSHHLSHPNLPSRPPFLLSALLIRRLPCSSFTFRPRSLSAQRSAKNKQVTTKKIGNKKMSLRVWKNKWSAKGFRLLWHQRVCSPPRFVFHGYWLCSSPKCWMSLESGVILRMVCMGSWGCWELTYVGRGQVTWVRFSWVQNLNDLAGLLSLLSRILSRRETMSLNDA
jgi:hypothetical protein